VPAPIITPQGGCAETPAQAKRKQLEEEVEEWLAEDEQEEEIVRAPPRKKTTAPQTKKGRGGKR
jgi:hypothetical protein